MSMHRDNEDLLKGRHLLWLSSQIAQLLSGKVPRLLRDDKL